MYIQCPICHVTNLAVLTSANARAELLEGGQAGLSTGEEQQQALLDNSETLEHTSARLTQGHKIALETEHIGAQILNDLHSQRHTIGRARDRVRSMLLLFSLEGCAHLILYQTIESIKYRNYLSTHRQSLSLKE